MSRFIYKDAPLDKEKLKQELEQSGHTMEDFQTAIRTTSTIAIYEGIYEIKKLVEQTVETLRKDPMNSFKGFGTELRKVADAAAKLMQDMNQEIYKDAERAWIIAKELHEYTVEDTTRCRFYMINYLGMKHCPKPEIFAMPLITNAMCKMVELMIEERIEEVTPHCPRYELMRRHSPTQLMTLIEQLCYKIEKVYPGTDDFDINQCGPLFTGINAVKCKIFDIDLMELHAAFGLEQVMSGKKFAEECGASKEILHKIS